MQFSGDMIGEFLILKVGEKGMEFIGRLVRLKLGLMRFGYRNINKNKITCI